MTDTFVPRGPNEPAALHACRYLLSRVAKDSNLAYRLNGTEALRLCVAAVAEFRGLGVDECTEAIQQSIDKQLRSQSPEVLDLREEVEDLRSEIEYDEDHARLERERIQNEMSAQRFALGDLLHHCKLTGRQPTVEAIESALKGVPADSIIASMFSEVAA